MSLTGELADRALLALFRWRRVGSSAGIQLSNVRDRDGRFYRAAHGAIQLIGAHAPHHLKRLRREFDWIVNRRLYSGEGAAWPEYRLRYCSVNFLDLDDDITTQAYLAVTFVGESVRSRFLPHPGMEDEERLLDVLERIDRQVVGFARKLDSVREGFGGIIADACENRTTDGRLSGVFLNHRAQLEADAAWLRKGKSGESL